MGSLTFITLGLALVVCPAFISGVKIPQVLLPCNPSCNRRSEICMPKNTVGGKTEWRCVPVMRKKPCKMFHLCERVRGNRGKMKYICRNYFKVTSPGFCPPVRKSLKFLKAEACRIKCRDDYDCRPGFKCCPHHSRTCGAKCIKRVEMPKCSDLN